MQSAYTTFLITSAPIEDIVFVAIVFALAALALFALAVEAGNYPKFSAGLRRVRSALKRLRSYHWHEESLST